MSIELLCLDAHRLPLYLEPQSINLLFMDGPYGNIVNESWDQLWEDDYEFAKWMLSFLTLYKPYMHPLGTVMWWGALGSHGHRPLYWTQLLVEADNLFYSQDVLTWRKRRARGSPRKYQFIREELTFYTMDQEQWTYNVPYTNRERGYPGYNKKHPAKSKYIRVGNVVDHINEEPEQVGNVVDHINELFRPRAKCEKPIAFSKMIVQAHTNPGDLVCDPFCGLAPTASACKSLKRDYIGCDTDKEKIATALLDLAKIII